MPHAAPQNASHTPPVTPPKGVFLLADLPALQAAPTDAPAGRKGSRLKGTSYSGAPVWGNTYVDLATLTVDGPTLPLLLSHDDRRVIGLIHAIGNDGAALSIDAELFDDAETADADALSVAAKARRGMKWQMSLGSSG